MKCPPNKWLCCSRTLVWLRLQCLVRLPKCMLLSFCVATAALATTGDSSIRDSRLSKATERFTLRMTFKFNAPVNDESASAPALLISRPFNQQVGLPHSLLVG